MRQTASQLEFWLVKEPSPPGSASGTYDRPLWKPGRHRIPELIVQLGEIGQGEGTQQTESTKVLAALGSGDGPLSVRVRPSSLKHDCDRRATSTGGKCLVNVHAKSRLTPEPLRTLRSETKGQAGACPDRTRAIPCKVRVGLPPGGLRRVDSNGDSNSSDHRQAAATGDSAEHSHDR